MERGFDHHNEFDTKQIHFNTLIYNNYVGLTYILLLCCHKAESTN